MRFLLTVFLLLPALPARAEWKIISIQEDMTIYVDPDTMGRGNPRRVMVLQNYNKRQPEGHFSARMLDEWDCKAGRYRLLSLWLHSEPMSKGKTLFSQTYNDREWHYAVPQTAAEIEFLAVCGKTQ